MSALSAMVSELRAIRQELAGIRVALEKRNQAQQPYIYNGTTTGTASTLTGTASTLGPVTFFTSRS